MNVLSRSLTRPSGQTLSCRLNHSKIGDRTPPALPNVWNHKDAALKRMSSAGGVVGPFAPPPECGLYLVHCGVITLSVAAG